MANVHVYSTLTCSQRYVKYHPAVAGGVPREERAVLIKGGTNVADKHFLTPKGVVTTITEEEYELLQQNELFKGHVDRGFIKVEKGRADVEKVASDMEARSPDAPIRPEDFQIGGQYEPDGTTIKAKKRK